MKRYRWLGAILIAATAGSADAQGIGGLIRKKVDEVVKPKEPAAAKTDAPTDGSTLGFELTEKVFESFKSALRLEVRMRDDFRARLARAKTPEEYRSCTSELATSADAQKAMTDYTTAIGKAGTDAETQQATTRYYARLTELHVAKCGENPQEVNAQRQAQAFGLAEDAAIREFARGVNRPPHDDDHHSSAAVDVPGSDACPGGYLAPDASDLEPCDVAAPIAPWHPAPLVADTITFDAAQGRYRILVEWVEKFCSMSTETRAEAARMGIRIAGTGNNIFWVYTAREAQWLNKDCDELKKLFAARQ